MSRPKLSGVDTPITRACGHHYLCGAKLTVLCRLSARPVDLEVRCMVFDLNLPLIERTQRYFQHLA